MSNRIVTELAELMDLYPGKRSEGITEETVTGYAKRLDDLPEHLVIQAITECANTLTFFPALAEIRSRVTRIAGESVLVDAESAWGEVQREIKRVGAEGRRTYFHAGEQHVIERQFSSPMIERAVDAVGWKDICLTDISDLPTLRAQFRDALRAIQHREVDRVVSGRQASPATAINPGTQPDGLKSIGDLVTIRDMEQN